MASVTLPQSLHHRRTLDNPVMICPWWSLVDCLKSPPCFPCLHVFQEDLFRDLAGHWEEADWSVIPRVCLFPFLINGCNIPFTSHWRPLLTAMTFQIWWRVAWQLLQPILSGLEQWGDSLNHGFLSFILGVLFKLLSTWIQLIWKLTSNPYWPNLYISFSFTRNIE